MLCLHAVGEDKRRSLEVDTGEDLHRVAETQIGTPSHVPFDWHVYRDVDQLVRRSTCSYK